MGSSPHTGFKTRAFIKVQDGCDSFCSYCIVPMVRGKERSLPPNQIVNEVKRRVTDGYKEVVLTGTKIGSYNYNSIKLRSLLERILAETDVIRLRLSSLQPQEISPELLRLWHDKRLCHHFHLPLQSGSDSVLSRMERHYSSTDYQWAVSLIRSLVPDVAITTDIIVGFPAETPTEFEQSYNFCRQMEFARIHVFRYSPRLGTKAAQMSQQVDVQVKKQRSQRMLTLAKESSQSFNQLFLGKAMPVLWEKQSDNIWSGLTDNYIKVYTRSDEDLTNHLLPVKLTKVSEEGTWGRLEKLRMPIKAANLE
jgi:threonylcarbamoyladenosine tRNA methylthiotransferase MtaB